MGTVRRPVRLSCVKLDAGWETGSGWQPRGAPPFPRPTNYPSADLPSSHETWDRGATEGGQLFSAARTGRERLNDTRVFVIPGAKCHTFALHDSHIYDPSADVRKSDSAGGSLYQPHPPAGQKQGFHNLGFSKSADSSLKLEMDNNHVNQRLHGAPARGGGLSPEGGLYIIQPDARWTDRVQSQVPVYPRIEEYGHHQTSPAGGGDGWEKSPSSVDEVDEGVGGTPDYPCDTGDEASVLSVDVHTSSTSLSSAATPDEPPPARTPPAPPGEGGGEAWRGEEQGEEGEEVQSVTDSMVAEALAALEAATAGEDCE
ncbi:unnamed protein product [Menidia menidia]|uniref:(Atlantic silverside) hypothetical protein n=1 Tax=Menidia menidia TaxID=238744 RepID=A0A8S4BBG7_9TELE|nr:unnamed protein product [Menidia menidia]